MHCYFATALSFLTLSLSGYAQNSPDEMLGKKQFIIILDMEPGAPTIFKTMSRTFKPDEIAFVGTTLLDSRRKAIFARKQLDEIGFNSVPVVQGNGGKITDYEMLGATRPYTAPIVSEEDNLQGPVSTRYLRLQYGEATLIMEMTKFLKENFEAGNRRNIDIILLSAPDDLLHTLENALGPAMKSIGRVHMRGDWTDAMNPISKKHELRSSNSWNMNFDATRRFLRGASQNLFPFSIRVFLTETLTLIGAAMPGAIQASRPIRIEFDLNDLDFSTGFRIDLIKPRSQSSIEVVDQMDCSLHLANVVSM